MNKHLITANYNALTNIILEFAQFQLEEELKPSEIDGIMKFIKYLMLKWESDNYVN